MAIYVVAWYEQGMAYGGPEEGGWYYDTGEQIRVSRVFRDEQAAQEFASRANRLFHKLYKGRPVWSAAYSGGYMAAEVYENVAPAHYPEVRPHYE